MGHCSVLMATWHVSGPLMKNMFSHKFEAETVNETFDLLKKKLQTFLVFAIPSNDKSIVVVAILKHSNVWYFVNVIVASITVSQSILYSPSLDLNFLCCILGAFYCSVLNKI